MNFKPFLRLSLFVNIFTNISFWRFSNPAAQQIYFLHLSIINVNISRVSAFDF